jgi:dTDP-4-dehydrorhamnose reductase
MTYLVIGAGQLGKEFCSFFNHNKIPHLTLDHSQCSIESLSAERSINDFINSYSMSIETIINCAAYNNVDKAESDKDNAFNVNAIGPKNLAIFCNKYNKKLVHFSSDYVFGDTKDSYIFRDEFAKTKPKSYYGFTKLQGEKFIDNHCNDYLILRTSRLFGKYGDNFISKILKKAKDKRYSIELSTDIKSKPTYAKDLVEQTMLLLNNNRCGLYHATNNGAAVSWNGYCKKIFEILKIKRQVNPTSLWQDDVDIRPNGSALLNSMLKLEGLDIMRDWEVALKDYLLNDMVK